jgi:WD40 repeat protein
MIRLTLILVGLLAFAPPVRAELPSEPILRLEPGMHGAAIRRIDVDAGERFLVTASDDKTVRVWALEDGRPLATLRVPIDEGAPGKVFAVAISPDGERIAAGGWGPASDGLSNSIYIFERASGRIVRRVDGLPDVIYHLAFSPDSSRLVAVLWGANGVRMYETVHFGEIAADRNYADRSNWAAFDSEGRLVTSSFDGYIRLYDTSFRLLETKKAPGGGRPFGVAFSPDGTQIAVGYVDSTKVQILDGLSLTLLFDADTTGVDNGDLSKVSWSADGRFLYAGGAWHHTVDGRSQMHLRRWAEGGRGAYENIALSRSTIMHLRPLAKGRLAFGAGDPSLGLLGPDGKMLWRQDPVQSDIRDVAASADGKRAFALDVFGRGSATFDLAARRLTLDAEPDPALATARTEAPGLEIENWKNQLTPTLHGQRLPLQNHEMARSLAIAPNGERFLLGAEWSLQLFDRQGKQLWQKSMPGIAWAVNITGDGRLAVAAFSDGTIRWFRLEDGAELLAFFPHADRERWVVWTPQGYYMASPGGEALIGWHVNRGLDTPEFYTAGRFRDRFHRPDVIALVLEELDVEKALARADAAAGAAAVTTPEAAKDKQLRSRGKVDFCLPVETSPIEDDCFLREPREFRGFARFQLCRNARGFVQRPIHLFSRL